MIAKLIQKNNCYYCSECRMKQSIIEPYCFFCDATFSNYEEELTKNFKDCEDNNLG